MPRPWAGFSEIRGPNGERIFGIACGFDGPPPEICDANVAYLLGAINAHDDLVAALRAFVKVCDAFGPNSNVGRALRPERLAANALLAKMGAT